MRNAETAVTKKRALTGIKPTGAPHIANYIGAIRPALALTDQYDSYYFIADYHALTVIKNPQEFTDLTYQVAAAWLAMGLDPAQSTIYRQSDLPETFELSWILSCVTPKGMLNRAHAYKAAVDQAAEEGTADVDANVNMGLYCYPVLMAADIILFSAHVVPVGRDQSQHVEYARDIAQKFNHTYGPTLQVPELLLSPTAATIIGSDGRKMSKSYGNQIPLFADTATLRKLIRRYKTDSTGADEPKDADNSGLFQIYREIAPVEDADDVKKALEAGHMSWGQLKDIVFKAVDGFLTEPRERYRALMADRRQVDRILAAGAEKARLEAQHLLARVRDAIGRVEMRP
ncbi:MAG: tryptophan--tRNA ligase [Pseudonocardiales bacterium]|nr:tryptophan--tRNA ligase [Pseudonocardiales bacterium]